MKKRFFSVVFDKKTVDIDTDKFFDHQHPDSFIYSNMKDCYTTGNGHGLQSNNEVTQQALMKLCDTIADAIYAFQEEIK